MNRVIAILSVFLSLCYSIFLSASLAQTNDGSSPEKAIMVTNISNFADCKDIKQEYRKSVEQEYVFHLPLLFGIEGKDWKVTGQRLITKDGRYFDQLRVSLLPSKKEKILYFEVTEPFTKYAEAYNKQKQK